jgi:DNA-binding MarR family transcriptional regulator
VPTHGRILLASLTASGRRALERGRALGLAVQDRVLAGTTDSDRQTLLRLLKAIEQRSAES